MRCKKHLSDPTSSIGVCATCLRERLLPLVAAQAQAQAQAHPHQFSRAASRASDDRSRNSDQNLPLPLPPPLIFPRSVSPYVSRRKSDCAAAWNGTGDHRDRLFYSTPQLGPNHYGGGGDFAANSAFNGKSSTLKKRLSKFWSFSHFFGSRSEKFQSDPSCEQSTSSASPPPSSWLSTFFPARRKNQDQTRRTEDSLSSARRRYRISDRGMSPVRTEDDADECDQSPSISGYTTESSPNWRRTPSAAVAPSARRSRLGHAKTVSGSGMAFCLSPLVRASPNRRWNHKGLPPEMAAAAKPHLSAAASFCANRSRKLADFGRVNHNR